MMMRRLAAVALSVALSAAAHAETTYPDCDKYKEPLAYNQCLASHGPSAMRALGARAVQGAGAETHKIHGVRKSWAFRRGRHGRMSASFAIERPRSSRRHGKFSQM